jgi:hypothetical protein
MALVNKAVGGWLLAKFLNQPRRRWYLPRARKLTPASFLLQLTPLGRFSLGGLALLAARRVIANRRMATATI